MTPLMVLDPLLPEDDAEAVVEVWRTFPSYGLYSNESAPARFAPELAQRYDAAVNFVRTGGRFGRNGESKSVLAARTNYFRETYAYGTEVTAPGIVGFYNHDRLLDAARALHDRPVIVPAIVYANILLPGQELAVHTDVPEFRGASRKAVPQWLLVVMHHAGLFDDWRMPIATAVSYFGGGQGGEFAYYPDGPTGDPAVYAPKHNTAVMVDTDSVFHGVDRVLGDESAMETLRPGMRLFLDDAGGDGDGDTWSVRDADGNTIATHRADEIRYSLSWKAYCFVDEAERAAWSAHTDDLTLAMILDRLTADLCDRAVLASPDHGLSDAELGRLLIDTYVRFPAPEAADAPA
ncbi:MAG TPA: hypothetical protein VGO92_00860 [Acidimicrobiales bacterium]|jgi:hypothetical protein|nr:hypothetical protein [Acidimicrobiales bacterium]